MAHVCEVPEFARLEGETILCFPLVLLVALLHVPVIVIPHYAVGAGILGLFKTLFKTQGEEKRVAETDIGEVGFWVIWNAYQEREVVELWTEAAIGTRNACREQGNLETERAKKGGEEAIEFVAEAAAP